MNCKEHQYHDFKLIGVMGILPYQELEVQCKRCNLEMIFSRDDVPSENDRD